MTKTWNEVYHELGEKLLEYEKNQDFLIDKLKDLNKEGLYCNADFNEVDPFTFIGALNRNISYEKKIKVFEKFKEIFKLKSEIPDEKGGIPTLNFQNNWFFHRDEDRGENDVKNLWNIFKQGINAKKIDNIDEDLFNRVLKQKGVRIGYLSMGLFWINPTVFMTLDKNTKEYFNVKKVDNFKEYKEALDIIKSKMPEKSFFEISKLVWNEMHEKSSKKGKKYWLFAPGKNAEKWEEFYSQGIIAIGWPLGDLRQYKSKKDIEKKLTELDNESNTKKQNVVKANYDFYKSISIGDIIIVKSGRDKLLGYGTIVSDYQFDDNREDYKSFRNVKWEKRGTWNSPIKLSLKTLTDITDKKDNNSNEFLYEKLLSTMKGTIMLNKKIENYLELLKRTSNIIFFGPPGTGKTYICNKIKEFFIDSEKISEDEKIIEIIEENNLTWNQIIFITMYLKGKIGPEKTIKVKELQNEKLIKLYFSEIKGRNKNLSQTLWGGLQSHSFMDSKTVNYSNKREPQLFDKTKESGWYLLKDYAENYYEELKEIIDKIKDTKSKKTEIKRFSFVTFHQSYGYEEFVEGIKPILDDETDDIRYRVEDGIFKRMCSKAKENSEKDYVIIIDEINRGNISKIFGELITLIEKNKRIGADEELTVKLPYSGKEFGVPKNLYIIGTMNTADRSIALIDTALRRRFTFIKMMPDYSLIDIEIEGINLATLLETINKKIEEEYDRDHVIGHSYFMKVKNKEDLINVFKYEIIPLMQEYFYDDWDKIEKILGKDMLKKQIEIEDIKKIINSNNG